MSKTQSPPAFFLRGCLVLVGLLTLTGCVTRVDGPPPPDVYVTSYQPETTVVLDGSYDYYPGYNTYYSRQRHQYAWQERGVWVSRPAPRDVSARVFLASPSVRMPYHDSPANHAAEMSQKYPKNWRPPAGHADRKNQPKDRDDKRRP